MSSSDFDRAVELYDSFTSEICDSTQSGRAASKDARYFLELQRDKINSLGISVKETLKIAGAGDGRIIGVRFDSPKYYCQRLIRSFLRRTDYFLNGRRISKRKEKVNLYQTAIFAKEGIDPNETYICPSCGGVSTFAALEKGCEYCGTRFVMNELFPKITDYVWAADYSYGKKEYLKRVLKWIGTGFLLGAFAGIFYDFKTESDLSLPIRIISGGITGIVYGFMLSGLFILARLIYDAARSVPVLARSVGDKNRLVNFMHKFDPDFFYEQFESRIAALMKIMLYSKNVCDSAVWCGDDPPATSDVIDAVYYGAMDIQKSELRNGYIHVIITLYATCTHFKNGKIKVKREPYQIRVVKHSSAVTDPAFSIHKVECSSCGASFDALRERKCPSCGNIYHLENYDWAVYGFRKL